MPIFACWLLVTPTLLCYSVICLSCLSGRVSGQTELISSADRPNSILPHWRAVAELRLVARFPATHHRQGTPSVPHTRTNIYQPKVWWISTVQFEELIGFKDRSCEHGEINPARQNVHQVSSSTTQQFFFKELKEHIKFPCKGPHPFHTSSFI